MNSLNETILANLRAELDLALANHKTMRTAYLQAEIAKLEKLIYADAKLRIEHGMEPAK